MKPIQNLKHFNLDGLHHIPSKLLELQQAITWQAGKLDNTTGKFSKYPKGKDGTGNSWPKPEQWVGNLKDAIELKNARGHSGVGIVLPAKIDRLHLVVFDYDDVDFNDHQRMLEITNDWFALGQPYMEISPSGKGLRTFVLSETPVFDISCANPLGGKDELFCSSKGRWMTVTCNRFKEGGLPVSTDAAVKISSRWTARKSELKPSPVEVAPLPNQTAMLAHLLKNNAFEWPENLIKDGGGRESTMLRFAGHLRGIGVPQAEIEKQCLAANLERYADPLSEEAVLDRARRYAGSVEVIANDGFEDWPAIKPLPPKYKSTPALEPEALPPAISGYVADCAKRMRIPAEMIATPLIVALGSVFGKKVCVQPRSKDSTWIEYPNLWGASILPPAMLKSPSLNAAMKFINEFETLAQRDHARAMAMWNSEERVRKLEIKALEAKANKAIKAGDRYGAKQHLDRIQEVKPPVRSRFVISDATPEARLEILCENPNGVLLLRDELDGHIAQLRKDGYENARAQELQFFDGHQDYSDDRIKRGSHIAEGPRMALYGNLQPAKVEKYLLELHKGGSDDGYLQRMLQLAIQPTITQDFELLNSSPNREAEMRARNLFEAAHSMALVRNNQTHRITPKILKFDIDAQVEFDQFLISLENKLRSGAISNPVIAAHLGKYRGTLPKLALILALALDPQATSISLEAYKLALNLLHFFQQHAKRIYGVVVRYDLVSAYELLDRIKKGQLSDGFNPRDDIQRKDWPSLKNISEIDAAIALLVNHGFLRVFDEPTGGRSKRVVRIHPTVLHPKNT